MFAPSLNIDIEKLREEQDKSPATKKKVAKRAVPRRPERTAETDKSS
jgi:hypothetical protein